MSGVLDRLGLGYDAMQEINPSLVYCALKGFLSGPYEQRAALDEVVQMMGGLAYMTGPEGRPLRAGASVNDVMGGLFGVIAIQAALWERQRTGKGTFVRAGLFENNMFLVAQHMVQYRQTGVPAVPMPERVSAWAVYDVFETADGEKIFVGVVSDKQWTQFCKVFGLDDLSSGRRTSDQRAAGGAPRCVYAAPARVVWRPRPVASRHDLWPRRTALRADPTTGPAFRRPSCKPHRCDGRSNPKQRRANAGSSTPI